MRRRCSLTRVAVSAMVSMLLSVSSVRPLLAAPGEVEEVLRVLEESRQAYAKVSDYTAHFLKEEWIRNRLGPRDGIFFKFSKPHTVFMAWIEGPRRSQQVLFAKGQFNDKMLVRASGFGAILGILRLDPHDPKLHHENPKPIDQAGIGYFLERFSRNFESAAKQGDLSEVRIQQVTYHGEPCHEIHVRYHGPQYEYPRVVARFSHLWHLPIYIELYDAQDRLVSRYSYLNLRLNVGHQDAAFLKVAIPYMKSRWLEATKR